MPASPREGTVGGDHLAGKTNIAIAFLNFRKLTDCQHQIRLGPLLDALDEAQARNIDVLAGAEIGTSEQTLPISNVDFEADWEFTSGEVTGQGVGAFFSPQWRGKWCVVWDSGPANFRAYMLKDEGAQILLGVFYAPHAGYGSFLRIQFWRVFSRFLAGSGS